MQGLDRTKGDLWNQAEAILRRNDLGGYTIPSQRLYPYQWLWDAGFCAMGWRHIDEARAWKELEMVISGQWPAGMLAHITFHKTVDTYFPGPDVWRSPHQNPATSGITQPPILGTFLWHLYRNGANREVFKPKARAIFQALLNYHRWLYAARDPDQMGLVAILHPWESGMDNSPLWDKPLARVVPKNVPPFQRADVAHVSTEQRPSDEEYTRYLFLVLFLRNGGYVDPALWLTAPFCVVDTAFNAILLRANRDLLEMARALGEPDAEIGGWVEQTEQGFDRLRDGKGGFYAGLDLRGDQPMEFPVTSRYLALWSGAPTPVEAGYLTKQFRDAQNGTLRWAPTVNPSAPGFQPQRYWRGPVWAITNWMLAEGFEAYGCDQEARRLRQDTLRLVQTAGFYEYFHPLTGEGLGGPNFSFTAAIVLELLAREVSAGR